MEFHGELRESYRVEVSGWDSSETFFVEKTFLDWSAAESKEVLLRSSLHEGSVIFMRLLQQLSNESTFPLPYQAVKVLPRDVHGRSRVQLAQLRPRETRAHASLPFPDSPSLVA